MSQSLRDFIFARLQELTKAEEPLTRQLKAIADERKQLLKAAEAAGIDARDQADSQPPTINLQITRRTIPERTIKDAVIEVLKERDRGMTALEILAAINFKFETDYPRTSLSPQLSRLKTDGKIERDGTVWKLRNRLMNLVEPPQQTDLEDALK